MKKREPIDDLFQDRLQDFSLEAPMHLWDNIAEAAIPEAQPRKRKTWLWFLLLPLLLLTGIGWAYLGNTVATQREAIESEKKEVQELIPASTPSNSTPTTAPSNQVVAQNNLNTSTPTQVASNNSLASESTASVVRPLQNDTEKNPAVSKTIASAEKLDVVENINLKAETQTLIAVQKDMAATSTNAQIDAPLSRQVTGYKPLTQNENTNAEAALPTWLLEPLNGPLLLVDNPIGDEVLTFTPFGKKPWLTTIDLMASMDFVMRQLEAKEPTYEDYARLRNNTETFRHGVSVGMRLSTISESGFAVRSGLNYSAINEQLNFKIKEEEKLIITTKYDQNGTVIGADTSIQIVGTYRIVNNRYTELDIPLLVGYEYVGDKVSFSFNGGVFINMLSAQKGEFISPNSETPVSFSSSDPNSYRAFKNRVGLGFYGSMGVYLQVKDNLQVLLEPYAKWRPGSYTVDGYFLDQRFLTTGLFVGVRKRII